jgi:hypothetical protein
MISIDLNLIFVIALVCFIVGLIFGVCLSRPRSRSRWE